MLGEEIRNVGVGADVSDRDVAVPDAFADRVNADVHVLRAVVRARVLCEVDRAEVVVENKGGSWRKVSEVIEETTVPEELLRCVADGHELGFDGGVGDGGLAAAPPSDEASEGVDGVAGGGLASLRAAPPVGVGVAGEGSGRLVRVVDEGVGEGSLNVAEEVESGFPVRRSVAASESSEVAGGGAEVRTSHSRRVHEFSDDLTVGEFRCESLLLGCGWTKVDGRWERSGARSAVRHVVGFEDGGEVLLEGKNESAVGTVAEDFHAEEVVDGTVVGDREGGVDLSLEGVDSSSRVGGDGLVVDVEGDENDVSVEVALVDAGIGGGRDEGFGAKPVVEDDVPLPRGLVDAVEGLEEADDFGLWDPASFRSLEIDRFPP